MYIYNESPYYSLEKEKESIIGIHLIGINKNYSIGVYGRIIGFTLIPVCYASPIWHLSKGSYCDGEMTDSFVLDLDCLLNLDLSQIMSKVGMFRGIPIFTQIEPDLAISSSLINNVITENAYLVQNSLISYDSDIKNSEISKILVNRYLTNNSFNKFSPLIPVSDLNLINNENGLTDITDSLQLIETIFSNYSLLGTINPNELFNYSINFYLNTTLLPEVKNFYKRIFTCMNCKSKVTILLDEECPNCGSAIEPLIFLKTLQLRRKELDDLLQRFKDYKLNEFTKNAISFIDVQLQS